MRNTLTILSLSTALVSLVLPSIAFADSARSAGAPGQAIQELPPGPERGAAASALAQERGLGGEIEDDEEEELEE